MTNTKPSRSPLPRTVSAYPRPLCEDRETMLQEPVIDWPIGSVTAVMATRYEMTASLEATAIKEG